MLVVDLGAAGAGNISLARKIKHDRMKGSPATPPRLTVVVVAFEMDREAPRTLLSLSRAYQRNIESLSYEVVLVDNGSPSPIPEAAVTSLGPEFRLARCDDPARSP